MDHVLEMLVLGVSILLVVVFILSATGAGKVAARLPDAIADMVNGTTSDIVESQYLKYCDKQITGSDVVSAIRKFKNDSVTVEVTVYTSASTTKTMSTLVEFAGSFQNIPASENYINPAAVFYGEAVRNSNDVIEKIKFRQQAYLAVAGGTALGAAGIRGSSTLKGREGSSLPQEDAVENDGSPRDLDIIFSDEEGSSGSDDSMVSEKAAYLGSVQSAIDSYSSELNDMVNRVGSFNMEDGDKAVLVDLKGAVVGLKGKVHDFYQECSTTKLMTDRQKKAVLSSLDTIDSKISEAINTIDSLYRKLESYEDSRDSWCIGYPVASDVKATLKDGVLTFSGTGGTAIQEELPKWYSRRKSIKKVVFEDGVMPIKMDYWFEGCVNLVSVNYIPKSVKSMNGTFRNCRSLSGTLEIKGTGVEGISSFRTCETKPEKLTVVVKEGSATAGKFEDYLKQDGGKEGKANLEVAF